MNTMKWNDDARGVSPAVGYMFIIGFVIVVALSLFLFGAGIFTGEEDPRIDANFNLEIQNSSHIEMYYDTGDEFTTDNTDELYVIGQAGTGSSIDKVMLYNESGVVQSEDPVATLEQGTLVVSATRAANKEITPNTSMQIVWEPKGHDNLQIVIDEMVVPSTDRILQVSDNEGVFDGQADMNISGTTPDRP